MTPVTTERPLADPVPANPVANTPKRDGERFHQLDGLRAVACLIVVFHHSFSAVSKAMQVSGKPALVYLGDLIHSFTGSGVELFFVLSGVVLLRPYVRGARPFKMGTYFLRRVERIWPPFLVVLLLEALLTIIVARFPTALSRMDRAFTFNFTDLALQAIIINFSTPIWNMAWWSLSIEVMFYVLVPFILPLFVWRRMDRLMIALVAALLWVAGLVFQPALPPQFVVPMQTAQTQAGGSVSDLARSTAAVAIHESAPAPWYRGFEHLAAYSLCFLVGIAIAKFDWRPREGWLFLGVGLLYVLIAAHVKVLNYHAAYALLYGGLVMLAFVRGSALQWILSRHLMVWIGERSYSLFLIHFTVFFTVNYLVSWFVPQKDLVYFVVSRAIEIPLAFFASMLLFHLVERRFARNLVTANEFWPPLRRALQPVGSPAARVSST